MSANGGPPVQLHVGGDPRTGVVQLAGPLDNPILMSWLLREANRIYDAHLAKLGEKEAPRIVVPKIGGPGLDGMIRP